MRVLCQERSSLNIKNTCITGKIESGKFELEMAPFDMREMVTSLACSFKAMMEAKSLQFAPSIDPRTIELITKYDLVGDRNRIRQVNQCH